MKKETINNETGEVVEEVKENYEIAKRELNALAIFDSWVEKQEQLLMAKEQFEAVDKPFRKAISELFEKYAVKSLKNDYVDITMRNGFMKSSWDEDKLLAFIYQHGANPKDFKTEKWQNGSLAIKYKG